VQNAKECRLQRRIPPARLARERSRCAACARVPLARNGLMAISPRRRSSTAIMIALAMQACAGRGHVPVDGAHARTAPVPGGTDRSHAPAEVAMHTRFELAFEVPGVTVAPDDVRIDARFTSPSGLLVTAGGFASHGRYRVRFTPREIGLHSYVIRADGGRGMHEVARGRLTAAPGPAPGFVRVDARDPHRLVRDDATPVYVLGENRINVYDPTWNHERVDTATYLQRMAAYGMRTIRVFIFADCESESNPGGYQIGCLEPAIGRFDEGTADAIDVLFDAAERHGIDVVLVAFAIGFTPAPETWRSWVDNPYSVERGGPAANPEDLFASSSLRGHTARKLRYIADRWAASPRLLAIDLLNEPEWDGKIPEATWIPWAEAMSKEWRSFDPYRHLVTVGPVGFHFNIGGTDERPWYASPQDDIVQWHLYGRQFYAPHALAIEMSRKVDETYVFGKPVVCGEFGYGGEDKTTYDHTHNGIWSLTFSGAGALAHSAPLFDLDSDAPMTPGRGAHFKILSDLLTTFGSAALSPARDVRVARGKARAWSLAVSDGSARAVWLLGPGEDYGAVVEGVQLAMPAPPAGRYDVTWMDDATGAIVSRSDLRSDGSGAIVLEVPAFARHIVGRFSRAPVPASDRAR
jgi:hypothetical protein